MLNSNLSKIAGAFALIGSFASSAYAATPTLYANGITAPAGTVEIGGKQWVSDHLQGFCRLDPAADGIAKITPSTCVTIAGSAGQATFDANRNLLYLPDNSSKSQGVWRLRYNPTTGLMITNTTSTNRPLLVARQGANRPTATALADNGDLLIGFTRTGAIMRVANPHNTPGTAVRVARTSTGGGVAGFTMLGSRLYIAEDAAVSSIPTRPAQLTACGSPCIASPLVSSFISGPTGIASDYTSIYVSDVANEVIKYTPAADPDNGVNTEEILVPGGNLRLLSGLGVNSARSTLFIGSDPTDGNGIAQGFLHQVAIP